MKLHRIYGMILRYSYNMLHNWNRLSDMFYWPLMDLLLWGLTGKYIQSQTSSLPNIILIIITGIIFWLIVWRAQYEITVNFLEEMWDKNLVNIFVSPLKFSEWVTAVLLVGVIKNIISVSVIALAAYFLYKTDVLFYGWYLVPFSLSLLLTGWAIGLFVAGIIMRVGTKVETLAWTFGAVLMPFSGVYYPIATLPHWVQLISKFIPASYIFENARLFVSKGYVNWPEIGISFILNCVYFMFALLFLFFSFEKAKEKGLINAH